MTQIITSNAGGGGGGAGAYKYKGSVQTYNNLPDSGMKVGDTYNVVEEHTTDPKFPAGSNVAWTGTEWDVLGGNFDLSDYQKKLTEGDGIDINNNTNEISVESTVINNASDGKSAYDTITTYGDIVTHNVSEFATSSQGAKADTALQSGDNVSELVNNSGYIDKDVDNLTNYTKTTDLGAVALSNSYPDLSNKPTIGNGTLTIQKNGTTVNSISMNSTANVTANISVPTKTSDLTNDSGFINSSSVPTKTSDLTNDSGYITNSALTGYQTTANLVTDLNGADNTHYPSAKAVADALSGAGAGDMLKLVYDPNNISANAFDYSNFINTPTIPGVLDSLTSSSTTDALSANQGKVLKAAIDNLSGLGKFLSLWDSTTGQPISFPLTTPYAYSTGDWFMVETVGATNYMPNGSSYTGTASITVESGTVAQGDVYIYDGTNWLLQKNEEVSVSFASIAGQPTDNVNLTTALNGKQDNLTAGRNIDLSSDIVNLKLIEVTVATAYNTAAKVGTTTAGNYTPTKGDLLLVNFVNGCSVSSATLNIDGSGAKNIKTGSANATTSTLGLGSTANSNIKMLMYYDGDYYKTRSTTNTTYSSMTAAEITAGTGTTARTITPANLKTAIQTWENVHSVNGQTGDVTLTIPTVNDATLTIQKNGTTVNTFTSNASSPVTVDIEVPTDTSDLTNGAGFITDGDLVAGTGIGISGTTISNSGVTSFNGSTGTVTYTAPVTSVNNKTGAISLYSSITVTLTAANWSDNEQTVTATGVTASNSVVISPDPTSIEDYAGGMVYCSAQASNSLTFTCTTEPENDITVNVLILN